MIINSVSRQLSTASENLTVFVFVVKFVPKHQAFLKKKYPFTPLLFNEPS